jgi:hypothetical protein
LLSGSREDAAMRSQWTAYRRNSSDGTIGRLLMRRVSV